MTVFSLIISNLRYFWKKNLLLALGVAISAAVLTGALIVGDSVQYSLGRIVEQRLGEVDMIIETGDRFVSTDLALEMQEDLAGDLAALLFSDGMAVADGGQKRINQVQVMGVDASFDQVSGLNSYFSTLSGDSVIISQNLAERLNIESGDEFLLRMTRASLIPRNAPFVSDAENSVSLRVTVKSVAGLNKMGRFNLKNSQSSPFNIFISREQLQDLMEIGPKVNLMLIASEPASGQEDIVDLMREKWTMNDAGLSFRESEAEAIVEVISDRVFIDDVISEALETTEIEGQAVLSYFVNSIYQGQNNTPYSFVSTVPDLWLKKNELMINTWLAEDLDAGPGDSIWLEYFTIGPLRELTVDLSVFIVKSVVPMTGYFSDPNLMPDLPGLSTAGNCRDWETGVPIDLESIRDKDEDYWTRWKGTPKAFISASAAVELWQNRFGKYTSYRYPLAENSREILQEEIMKDLDPSQLGITVRPVLSQAEYAAENGVDFSELFGGLSFFLLAGGILLTILLFLLNLGDRKEQLETMTVMGIPLKMSRRVIVYEGMVVSLVGALLGLALAVLYNRLVFSAINGVWADIVRTEMMSIDIKLTTLLTGFAATIIVAWLSIFFPLNNFLKKKVGQHRTSSPKAGKYRSRKIWLLLGELSGAIGLGLIIYQVVRGEIINATLFFPAGGLLLISGITMSYALLFRSKVKANRAFSSSSLSTRNASRNKGRSMSIVILFALGAFLVISTGSNKKDLFINAADPTTGTGGFLYYAESTVPVLQDLNSPPVKYEYGITSGNTFLQLRISDGDDASCLNLNKITNPRILGVDPSQLSGRFSFVTASPELVSDDPWSSLNSALPGDVIPAIADETVIKWSLGLKVGDTLQYMDATGNIMNLLLVGGLAPSIFQGNVLISNQHFLKHFPQHSGTEVFLVDGEISDTALIRDELEMGMRDLGWTMTPTAERLATFNSVTNTYLSIFLVMGALGLLLGTIGLAIVLYRSILERRSEIALLRASGFSLRHIKKLIIREYMILLAAGSGIGFLAAVVATLPSIISPNTEVSFISIIFILAILLLNGWFWIWLLTGSGLRHRSIYSALRDE